MADEPHTRACERTDLRICNAALWRAHHGLQEVYPRSEARRSAIAQRGVQEKHHTFEWAKVNAFLREDGVTLISAGLDEVRIVHKNIHEGMPAHKDLVTILRHFDPKWVKLAPHGERPED